MIPIFAIYVAILLGGLVYLDLYAFPMPLAAVALEGQLTATQEEAIRLLSSQSGFLVSLTLAVFAGCAAIVLDKAKKGAAIGVPGLCCLAAVVTCSAFSIFFSHMLASRMIEMIANDILILMTPAIVWSFRLQYAALLAALVSAAFFVLTEVLIVQHEGGR